MKHKHTFKHVGNGTFTCTRCHYTWNGIGHYVRRVVTDPMCYLNVVPFRNPTRGGISHQLELKVRSNT